MGGVVDGDTAEIQDLRGRVGLLDAVDAPLRDDEAAGGDGEETRRWAGDVGRTSEGKIPNAAGPDRDRRRLCCLCQRAMK